MGWSDFVGRMNELELRQWSDIYVLHLGPGGSIPQTSRRDEGLELIALGEEAFGRLLFLDIKIQISDTLGNVHEKKLRCLRPRPGYEIRAGSVSS